MENLKNLFTEQDFDMLNKAIDALPKLGFSSMMMTEMLFIGLGKDEDKEKREKEREERFERQKNQDKKMEDQCLELKFKLLSLKKALQ